MKHTTMVRSLAAAGLISLALGGYGIARNDPSILSEARASAPAAAAARAQPVALPDFAEIAAKNGPAVVNISVTRKEGAGEVAGAMPRIDPDNPFFEFFRQFRIPAPQGEAPMGGIGSGFIVSPDGVILTNAHVVGDATDIRVKLTDRREFKAKVIGRDEPSDVAVLKIEASGLPTVKLDTADDVRVGEWVLAIGSPFGFESSVTSGIVSAKYRSLGAESSYVPFIQTDVAVNPGNSGGPLFNANGEVIGINSQIYSRSGGYQGLSFAIPISVALHVKDQIMAHGKVTRGRLGVTIQEVDQSLAQSFGLKSPAGALVTSVEKGGPAARAGLEVGDVIVRFNGKPVASSNELPILVAEAAPGSRAAVVVQRKGEPRELAVTVGELKGAGTVVAAAGGADQGRLGVAVRPLSQAEKSRADLSGGVVVESVAGPAAAAGIRPGDVILSLNNTPVTSPGELKDLVTKAGKHVALLVQRDEARIFVPLDLG